MVAAAIGAVFDLIPAVFPFFAPGEGTVADGANLGGEIGFFDAAWHIYKLKQSNFILAERSLGEMFVVRWIDRPLNYSLI